MQQRALGNQGLIVSAQGLGCMGMSEFYSNRDDKESAATILHAQGDFLDPARPLLQARHGQAADALAGCAA